MQNASFICVVVGAFSHIFLQIFNSIQIFSSTGGDGVPIVFLLFPIGVFSILALQMSGIFVCCHKVGVAAVCFMDLFGSWARRFSWCRCNDMGGHVMKNH